jgi:hypothetical protein
MIDDSERLSWRVKDWLKAAGYPFSKPVLYSEIHAGRIDARKIGKNTLIITSPREYLESLPKRVGPAVGRARVIRARKAAEAAT